MNNAVDAHRLTKSEALRELRDLLVDLYDNPDSIRRVVEDAGIDSASVNFVGAATEVWHGVLKQAAQEDKVTSVVSIAAQEYPRRAAALDAADQAYGEARRNPVSRRTWLIAGSTVLSVALLAITLHWTLTRIEPMSSFGRFNIAVAQFPIVDANGRRVDECVSKLVSDWIYRTVLDLPTAAQAQTLTDSRGPDQIGVIQGKDVPTRQERVEQLADDIHATIFVHGVITQSANRYEFQPEFYVSPEPEFSYAGEIIGPNRLGDAVTFVLPSGVDCDTLSEGQLAGLNERLDDRLTALRYVMAGLRYFYAGDYQLAYDSFEQTTHLPNWPATEPGQEVVHLLMGSAKLRLSDAEGDPEAAREALAAAQSAFSTTVQINQEYGRGYLGLGAVALLEAQVSDALGTKVFAVEPNALMAAQHWYSQSLQVVDQPPMAYVPIKANLGIGQTHLIGFEHHIPGWSGREAYDRFTAVTQAYEAERAPGLIPLAASAYAHMGRLEGHNGNWQAMIDFCRRAIRLLETPDARPDHKAVAEYWSWIGLADEQSGDLCRARDDYRRAIDTGQSVVHQASLDQWQQKQDKINQRIAAGETTCDN